MRFFFSRAFIFFLPAVFLIALAIAGGWYFFFANQGFSKSDTPVFSNPVTLERQTISLSLSGPDDEALVFDPNLLIQGTSSPQAVIILSWNGNNKAVEAGSDGSFSSTIKLQSGVNNLKVTAFDKSGENREEDRIIYYSTEKL